MLGLRVAGSSLPLRPFLLLLFLLIMCLLVAFCRQTLWAQSQVVNQNLLNGFVDITMPYFDDGGRQMVMLDNRLYLVSVLEFLRRSRVDHGTRGSRVVVGTDLSKRKVTMWCISKECQQCLRVALKGLCHCWPQRQNLCRSRSGMCVQTYYIHEECPRVTWTQGQAPHGSWK
jgi:hypothetical protein